MCNMHNNDNYFYFYFVYRESSFTMLHFNFTWIDDLLYDSGRHFSNLSDVEINFKLSKGMIAGIICLFVLGFITTRGFWTHLETSPLAVKGCKF